MAPERLVKEKLVQCASIDDLILSDVWALGMIVFTMINPSLKCPNILEIRSAGGLSSQEELKKLIISLLATEKRPLQDVKYELDRATAWCDLENVYRSFTKFDQQQRLTLEEAGWILSRREGIFSRDIEVIHLKVSQATSLERFDLKMAAELERPCLKPLQMKALSVNDGKNACAYFAVRIAERILNKSEIDDFFENLPDAAESIIWSLPVEINNHRDLEKNYDALEAHDILRKQHLIKSSLEFSEGPPFGDGVFTYEGREHFFLKLCALGKDRSVHKQFFCAYHSLS